MSVKCEESFPLNVVSRLYLSDELSDVRIQVVDKSFPAHKTILAASCEFFKIFFGDDKGNEPSVIHFDDRSEDQVKFVLKFIYTGTVDLTGYTDNQVIELYTFCLFLKLCQLSDHLYGFICAMEITVKNVAKLLNLVDQYEITKLINKCWIFLDNNLNEVVDENQIFVDFSLSVIVKMIERYSKRINMCPAVSIWLQRHPNVNVNCIPVNLLPKEENEDSQSLDGDSLPLNNPECTVETKVKKEPLSGDEEESNVSEPKIKRIFSKRFQNKNWTKINPSILYTFDVKGETLLFELNQTYSLNYMKFQLLDDILRLYSFQVELGESPTELDTIRFYNKNVVYASVVEIVFEERKVKFFAIKSFGDAFSQLQLYLTTFHFCLDTDFENHQLLSPKHNVACWFPVGEQLLLNFKVAKDIIRANRIVFVLRYPCHIYSLSIEFHKEYKREITVSISQRFNGFWSSVLRGVRCNSRVQRIVLDGNPVVSFIMIEGEGVNSCVRTVRCPDTDFVAKEI